jgi:hypothetical protein
MIGMLIFLYASPMSLSRALQFSGPHRPGLPSDKRDALGAARTGTACPGFQDNLCTSDGSSYEPEKLLLSRHLVILV